MDNDSQEQLSPACLETLKRVVEAAELGLLLLDGQGRVLRADGNTAAAFGVDRPRDILGRDLAGLIIEDFDDERKRLLQSALEEGGTASFEQERDNRVYHCIAAPLENLTEDGAVMVLAVKDITELRRADENLRRERQRHIFLMEALPGFLLLVGEDRQIHYSNRQFRKLFGKGKGVRCEEIFNASGDQGRECPGFEKSFSEKPMEWEWQGPNGRYYQIYTHPMTDADGSLKVIVHGLDITARKEAEMELKRAHDQLEKRVQERTAELMESEARFRAVVEDQTELICRFTSDRTIYFVNGAFCRFFGRSRKELIGQQFLPGVVEEDRWMLEGFFDPITLKSSTRTLEFRVKLGVSAVRWLRWSIRGIYDAQGRLVEYQGVGRDITGLRHAEKRYYNLIQNLPIIIFALNYEFQLTFINDTCRSLLGYDPDQALATHDWFFDRVHPEDRNKVREVMFSYPLQDSEKGPSVEFRFEHQKGYLVNLMARPIPPGKMPSSGAFDRVEGIIMDVTERMFLDKMLVQREKLNTLGAMSDELAHEIRNPLFALGGYARRLREKQPELMEAEVILDEALRLEDLLDRIRRYLEPVSVSRQPCQVNILLSFSADLMANTLAKHDASLVVEADEEMPSIHSDPDVLSQVFMNLFTNGMAAIQEGGTIHVSTYETKQHVGVDFRLSPMRKRVEDQEQLFMPFEADDEGVNLAVSYRLLKNVDGYLDFKQNGDSARFTVLLPKNGEAVKSIY